MKAIAELLELKGEEKTWLHHYLELISERLLASMPWPTQVTSTERRGAILHWLQENTNEESAKQTVSNQLRRLIDPPPSAIELARIASRENGYLTIPLLGWLGDSSFTVIETLADWASFVNPWTGQAQNALVLIPESLPQVVGLTKKALDADDEQAVTQLLSTINRMAGPESEEYLGLVQLAARHPNPHIRDVAALHFVDLPLAGRARLVGVEQALREDPVSFVRDTMDGGI